MMLLSSFCALSRQNTAYSGMDGSASLVRRTLLARDRMCCFQGVVELLSIFDFFESMIDCIVREIRLAYCGSSS